MFGSRLNGFLLAAIPLLVMTSVPMHASTIFSENFDAVPVGFGLTTAGQFSTINGTNVDVVGPGNGLGFLCAAPESGNCVDLGGTGGNPMGQLQLTTALNLAPGVYNLSFDLVGSGRGVTTSTTVTFGSYTNTFVLASGDTTSGIVINQMVTVAGGSTQLLFVDNGANGNVGALLDSVVITNPSATPEPSSLMLLGTGVLGLAGAMRRKMLS